jgi:hypothetical protein
VTIAARAVPSLVLLCLCLGGCASVPLSTMVRMSTFDERDFARLDPAVLRVRITLPEGFGLNVTKSWLGVQLKAPAGVHHAAFELDQERKQGTEIPGGVFADAQFGTAYVLRLTKPSRTQFRQLQGFVSRGRADEIVIQVVPRLSATPKNADTVKVWIDLLLSDADGFFTLVDGASIPLEKLRED